MDIPSQLPIADSVAYLESAAAHESIARDPYWPKWHSPWWHMLLLWELGEAARIPRAIAERMAAGIDGLLHTFPITEAEVAGVNLQRDIACHCALGCMAQVLAACGIDIDRALPWVKPWFARYQMRDGGLSCDEEAYRCTDECPSSMVGTIAPFEAMLALGGDDAFVARGADFLIGRALVRGSDTKHNADERTAALAWVAPCFPRFYFYDTLRGLSALVRWAEQTGSTIPREALEPAVSAMRARAPDGIVRVERQAHAGKTTVLAGEGRTPATSFPLLDAVSMIGAPSPVLTRQWRDVQAALARLAEAGQIV